MFRIKRLHTFVLEHFLPVFVMTFMISNFILVMQLLWRHIDKFIGKGIELGVFMEFFWNASLSLVPMSLPLAVLLASLMTFGNFGERLELLSMKAAGISLFKIMKPLIVLMAFICLGAFYFQDNTMPKVQVRLWSLLTSFKQKSPELSVPEGAFFSDIAGVTIYVKQKDTKKNLLKDLMIYDFSDGYDNAAVTLAKTGKLRFTSDKKHLVFTLFDGEGFSNFNNQQPSSAWIPYRRETFRKKELVFEFDANFNRVEDANFSGLHFSKNTKELGTIIDSVGHILDSLNRRNEKELIETVYLGRRTDNKHRLLTLESARKKALTRVFIPNVDSLLKHQTRDRAVETINRAKHYANKVRSDMEYKQIFTANDNYQFRRSSIEYHRKFTLSFACLIFFFIGAPLGAIIRKGGIGTPAVVSVILFIIYYMIDLSGYKFARDGIWEPVLGVWISSAAMLPLGLFLTYKAVNDSAILNSDAYVNFYKTWLNPKWVVRRILSHKKPTV